MELNEIMTYQNAARNSHGSRQKSKALELRFKTMIEKFHIGKGP